MLEHRPDDVVRGRRQPRREGLSERLVAFKRVYRWLNLTAIHHAIWPLLLLLTSAPSAPVGALPVGWYTLRLMGPALATALALIYLAQSPLVGSSSLSLPVGAPEDISETPLRSQVRFALIGLTGMLAVGRLAVGPVGPVAQLLVFGAADVAAFQLIHFGVVARSYPRREQGRSAALGLFALSWGVRDAIFVGIGGGGGSLGLALLSGLVLGGALAALSAWLRAWLGGFWPAAMAQWLIVYLIFGFVA
ncbi:MAG: hypothetical protein M3R06_01325 [Chloroflexota bacterium]|nr:hypothetical protein [Chloroflexota bacterium]